MATDAQGTCDPRFEPVRAALAGLVESGQDVGCSAAVVHEGKLVADVWAGHADAEKTTPWERDTIVNVWSTTKTMTNLSALVLADRGEIDLDAPVADYWPEFKANGKEGVLVRHLLAHTAGLPSWRTADRGRGPVRLGQGVRDCSPTTSRGGSRARPAATTP